MLVSFDDDTGFSDDGNNDTPNAAESGDEGTDEGTASTSGNTDKDGHTDDDAGMVVIGVLIVLYFKPNFYIRKGPKYRRAEYGEKTE